MSFYVGRHRTGATIKKQCHITSGQHDLATMQGGVQTPTIFHTDIQYLQIKSITNITLHHREMVLISQVRGESNWPWIYTKVRYSVYKVSNYIRDLINSGYVTMVLSGDYSNGDTLNASASSGINVYSTETWPNGEGEDATTSYIPYDSTSTTFKLNGNDIFIKGDSHYRLTLAVLGFKYSGGMDSMPKDGSQDILIEGGNSPTFNVNGLDVAKLTFVHGQSVNDFDSKVNLGPNSFAFQLVNSRTRNGGISFSSSPSGTKISVGGHAIINSSVSSLGLKPYRQGSSSVGGHYIGRNPTGSPIYDFKVCPYPEPGEIMFYNISMPGYGNYSGAFFRGGYPPTGDTVYSYRYGADKYQYQYRVIAIKIVDGVPAITMTMGGTEGNWLLPVASCTYVSLK